MLDQLSRIYNTRTLPLAIITTLELAIPGWVDEPGRLHYLEHGILIGILILIFIGDWITGTLLAKRGEITYSSKYGIQSIIRTALILILCAAAYGMDYLFNAGAWIFSILTLAFIYRNLASLVANIMVLGWGSFFPIWLWAWLSDEVKRKREKYFPSLNEEEKS
jgi:phage-related holin